MAKTIDQRNMQKERLQRQAELARHLNMQGITQNYLDVCNDENGKARMRKYLGFI